jgi:UDP-N-acetylglucosamine--N-acetylmuramyl-(pentapeptide) pyrophosphoryl-undecaprenol N-acetylglucosamine transferase
MKTERFIIAGGGTGGHIFPAIAIANAIKRIRPEAEILFVGAKGKMEMEKVPQAGYAIEGLTIAGFNRSSLIKNLHLPYKLIKSFMQVAQIIRRFKPNAVIGVGGYSSFPVLRYAQSKGIPTFLHESNSHPGKSNILLGKKATRIFLPGEGMAHFFPANKSMITGNPVRQTITEQKVSREEALRFFGLDANKRTVLSIGGSLGAKSINEALEKDLEILATNDLQLIWQTGKPFKEQAETATKGKKGMYVSDFIMQMEYAYAAADMVISRSGAMAVSELCVVKKPVVFVPYPFAAEDHQTVNALALVDKGAAWLVKDSEAAERLVPAIIELSKDEQLRRQLAINIGKLGVTDADTVIANEILKNMKEGAKES